MSKIRFMTPHQKAIERLKDASKALERLAEAAEAHIGPEGDATVLSVLTSSMYTWVRSADAAVNALQRPAHVLNRT